MPITKAQIWEEAASIVLVLDSAGHETLAKQIWPSHLARAKWMVQDGYHLLSTVDQGLWEATLTLGSLKIMASS